jgi:hypothetical protein
MKERARYGRQNRRNDKKRDAKKKAIRLETMYDRDWSVSQHRPRAYLKH